jgi:hypothetical protein
MKDIQDKLRKIHEVIDSMVLEIAAKAKENRRYPHYETSDKLDRCMIYTQNAGLKIAKARNEIF